MANTWARLWDRLLGRDISRYGLDQYLQDRLNPYALTMPVFGTTATGRPVEEVENSFTGYTYGAYKSDGVVFATILSRMLLFTEARFQFQQLRAGRPGDLFGNQDLALLEHPLPNGTTGELLARMEQDVSLAGNFYAVNEGDRLRRLRPDWVSIVLSAPPEDAVESDVLGYLYTAGGRGSGGQQQVYLPDDIAHWSPIPDPVAQYRGMSWLTPVIREVQADQATTMHKLKFFENGATPQVIVRLPETVGLEKFQTFAAAAEAAHQGVDNAYRTWYMGAGADATVVGANLQQLDFKATQGAGETRITAAGGVPAVIVGLSEGLQAATYSNYGQARRKFGDHWARPQWRSACAALETIIPPPAGSRLWYDTRDIAFLREDQKDAAEIFSIIASAIRTLTDAGWHPDAAVKAAMALDPALLLDQHSGLYSVQLQPPGTQPKALVSAAPALNGSSGG